MSKHISHANLVVDDNALNIIIAGLCLLDDNSLSEEFSSRIESLIKYCVFELSRLYKENKNDR